MVNLENEQEKQKKANPLDDPKIAALWQEAEAYEQAIKDKAQEFNIDDFTEDWDTVKTIVIDGVNYRYKRFTVQDQIDLDRKGITDPTERGLRMLVAMLAKVDSKVTYEKMLRMNNIQAGKILDALSVERRFLSSKKSAAGST